MNVVGVEEWIKGLSNKERRAYRILTYTCSGCGSVMVEVCTEPVPVIVTRKTVDHPDAPARTTNAERIAYLREHGRPVRKGEMQVYMLPDPLPDPADTDDELVFSTCDCQRGSRPFTMRRILTDLGTGRRRQTI